MGFIAVFITLCGVVWKLAGQTYSPPGQALLGLLVRHFPCDGLGISAGFSTNIIAGKR